MQLKPYFIISEMLPLLKFKKIEDTSFNYFKWLKLKSDSNAKINN